MIKFTKDAGVMFMICGAAFLVFVMSFLVVLADNYVTGNRVHEAMDTYFRRMEQVESRTEMSLQETRALSLKFNEVLSGLASVNNNLKPIMEVVDMVLEVEIVLENEGREVY